MNRIDGYLFTCVLLLILSACGPSSDTKEAPPAGDANTSRLALPEAWAGWAALSSDGKYLVYAGGESAEKAGVSCWDVANNKPYRKVSPDGVVGCRWIRIANPSAVIAYVSGDEANASVRVDSYLGGTSRVADSVGYASDIYFGYDTKRICWVSQKPNEKFRTIRYTATTQSDVAQWQPRSYDILHPVSNANGAFAFYTLANPASPELHIADYGGSNDRLLDSGALEYGPAYITPNEKYIVFGAKAPGTASQDLYRITFEGTEKTALTKFDTIGRIGYPVVTPDGNYVYFLYSAPSDEKKSGLWRVGLLKGEPEQVASAAVNPNMPLTMSADGKLAAFAVGLGIKSEIWLVSIPNAPPVYAF